MSLKLVRMKDPAKERIRQLTAPDQANIAKSHMFRLQVMRERQDVKNWRDVRGWAERAYFPSRVGIQKMYADTKDDGHVIACYNKRVDMTLQRPFFIGVDDKENEQLKKMFNTRWFTQMQNDILDAKFFGYTFLNWGGVDAKGNLTGLKVIPRENCMPDIGGLFTTDQGGVNRIPSNINPALKFTDEAIQPWTMWVTTPDNISRSSCGFGEFYPVSLYAILLRNNLGYNSDFVEKFMTPLTIGKTNKTDRVEREEFLKDLSSFGSSAAIVLDFLDEISFVESKNTGTAYNSFDNYEKRLHALISKIMLGHADALDSTPGKLGNNDNALQSLKEKAMNDGQFVEDVINDQFLDKLRLLGFDVPDGTVFKYSNDEQVEHERNERADFNIKVSGWVKSISDAGYEVDENELSKVLGFNVKKKSEPIPATKKDITASLNKLYDESV
jgi:hypothetical protein